MEFNFEDDHQNEEDGQPADNAGNCEDLRLFDIDDGVRLEDPRKGLNQSGIQKNVILNAAEKRWFTGLWRKKRARG